MEPRALDGGARSFFCFFSLYVRVLQSARFGYRQTGMKHNKFKRNKLTTAASQDENQKPQQEYVFSNLPVSGIQGQTEMEHAKFKINKLTTAAWTKAENHKTSKKGFMWDGSDGVDHVAREVLQHGVAKGQIGAPVIVGMIRHVVIIPASFWTWTASFHSSLPYVRNSCRSARHGFHSQLLNSRDVS